MTLLRRFSVGSEHHRSAILRFAYQQEHNVKLFNLDDTAVILIDHQVGTNTWASTTPLPLLQRNVVILAKFARGTGLPVVLTSSQETNINVQGPLMPELQEALPDAFAARIKRQGVVNAWDDPAFAAACRNTGRKNFVMAGVTTDVCMVSPAISAVEEGFTVKVVCDACGSTNQIAEEMSWRRMEAAGVHLTSTNAIVAELVKNWASPAGAIAFPLLT
jgi:nicotinamidase-related amidase